MSKKLAAKNALIEMPVSSKAAAREVETIPIEPRTRTAVGGMAQFVTTQSPIHREAEMLREQVRSFDGAKAVRALDPAAIRVSEWANRHEDTFASLDFAHLKREIKEAGGNIQPIKVRPLNRSTADRNPQICYEIVFGHRRHRACLELNIAVNALIEEVGDQTLFEEMERENRDRKNLSAWEQGRMYQAALEKGLYPSQRKLSESIGVDVSLISKSIALAKLPAAVMGAFTSPLDVQYRWAQPLGEALERDREGTLAKAAMITTAREQQALSPGSIFTQLCSASTPSHVVNRDLQLAGKKIGVCSINEKGAVFIRIPAGELSPALQDAFVQAVEQFFHGR